MTKEELEQELQAMTVDRDHWRKHALERGKAYTTLLSSVQANEGLVARDDVEEIATKALEVIRNAQPYAEVLQRLLAYVKLREVEVEKPT